MRQGHTRPAPRVALSARDRSYYRWKYLANGERALRAGLSLVRPRGVRALARALAEDGVVVAPSRNFLSADGQAALRKAAAGILDRSRADAVQAKIAARDSGHLQGKKYLIELYEDSDLYRPDGEFLEIALDQTLLSIVAAYMGLWPRLFSIGTWLNFATEDEPIESQLWHRDPEDVHIVKAFIYLSDVGEDSGPFTYLPGSHPFGSRADRLPVHAHPTRVTDDEMRAVHPEHLWKRCVGPAETMILADTVGFHKGGKPARGIRVLVTFAYTSGAPFEGYRGIRPARGISLAHRPLSAIQRFALRD